VPDAHCGTTVKLNKSNLNIHLDSCYILTVSGWNWGVYIRGWSVSHVTIEYDVTTLRRVWLYNVTTLTRGVNSRL
jgi:hypothetical protein